MVKARRQDDNRLRQRSILVGTWVALVEDTLDMNCTFVEVGMFGRKDKWGRLDSSNRFGTSDKLAGSLSLDFQQGRALSRENGREVSMVSDSVQHSKMERDL